MVERLMCSNKARFDSQTPPMKLHLLELLFTLQFWIPAEEKNRGAKSRNTEQTESIYGVSLQNVMFSQPPPSKGALMTSNSGQCFKSFSTWPRIHFMGNTTLPSNSAKLSSTKKSYNKAGLQKNIAKIILKFLQ